MKDDRISVRFPAEPPAKAVAHRSRTQDTVYELARSAGLIGVVKGARKDLSTNPEHFRGFGGS